MDKHFLKENRIHGDILFPLETYGMSYWGPNSNLNCHWHDELELLLVTEGRAVFQIETAFYEADVGHVLFINSGELHAAYPADDKPWSFRAVVFNPAFLKSEGYDSVRIKYLDPMDKKLLLPPRHMKHGTSWEKSIAASLRELFTAYEEKAPCYEIKIKGLLLLMLSQLLANGTWGRPDDGTSRETQKTERIKRILSHIHEHYGRKITLEELASQINMSEGHFCRFFKEMVNKSPVDYMNYFRVNKAAALLKEDDRKIIEIAMEVGFDNTSYFISLFKHYMGTTPTGYRKGSRQEP